METNFSISPSYVFATLSDCISISISREITYQVNQPVSVAGNEVVEPDDLPLRPAAGPDQGEEHPAHVAPRDRAVDVADHDPVTLTPEVDVAGGGVGALEPGDGNIILSQLIHLSHEHLTFPFIQ